MRQRPRSASRSVIMHTISESGHTGDVLACIHGLDATIRKIDKDKLTPDSFRNGHPRLDQVKTLKAK